MPDEIDIDKETSPSASRSHSSDNDAVVGSETNANDEKAPPSNGDFPEGGARAWGAALGAAGISFCSLGYCNAFGYDFISAFK